MSQNRSSLTDEELMQRYKLGDYVAFEELYSRHSSKVFGFLKKRVTNEVLAREIFQEAFLKLHRHRSKYNPSLPFLPWLFTLTRNAMLDRIRKEQRETSAREEIIAEDREMVTEGLQPDLSILSMREQSALQMRFGEDLGFEQIASKLETSQANVRQIISRAIKKLRRLTAKSI